MRALQPPFVGYFTKLASNRRANLNRERNMLLFTGVVFLLNGGLNIMMASSGSLRSGHAIMAVLMFAVGALNLYRARRLPMKRELI